MPTQGSCLPFVFRSISWPSELILCTVIEVHASGVPAGWGAPIYGKLDSDIAMGMMSINAAKGVEIGAGFN